MAVTRRIQEDAGVARADVFVASTGDDDDNLVACQLAKVAFGVPRAVARVNNPKNEHIFNALGIEAISSTTIIARMIEEEATVGDLRTLISLRQGNMAIVEIELPTDRCVVCNKRVAELPLPVDCVLIALVRGEDDVVDSSRRHGTPAGRCRDRVHRRRAREGAQEGAHRLLGWRGRLGRPSSSSPVLVLALLTTLVYNPCTVRA